MRVVFLDDVEHAGRAGEIKEGKDGYARTPRRASCAARNTSTVQQASQGPRHRQGAGSRRGRRVAV